MPKESGSPTDAKNPRLAIGPFVGSEWEKSWQLLTKESILSGHSVAPPPDPSNLSAAAEDFIARPDRRSAPVGLQDRALPVRRWGEHT